MILNLMFAEYVPGDNSETSSSSVATTFLAISVGFHGYILCFGLRHLS